MLHLRVFVSRLQQGVPQKRHALYARLFLKIKPQKFLHREDDFAEKWIGNRGNQRLTGRIHQKGNIGKTGKGGVFHFGEGDDLKTILLCPAHVVQDQICFTALGDGNEERWLNVAFHGISIGIPKQHIVVEMDPVEHGKSADGHAVGDVIGSYIRKTRTDHKAILFAVAAQTGEK